jgi:hypothetical protein
MKNKKTIYSYLWKFRVKNGCERRFETIYGPNGEWVKLFQQSKGYIRTEFLKDLDNRRDYITIDYWKSKKEFDTFRKTWKKEFNLLDKHCESLTEKEGFLGSFAIRVF